MFDNAQIFGSIDLGLIVLDRDLIARGWNRWMELHSGISSSEIIGSPILELYPNFGEPKYKRLFRSVLSFGSYACFSQKLHQYLIPLKNPHSSVVQMPFMQQSCSANPLRDEHGGITGFFITVHDVTEYAIYEHKLLEMTKIDALTRLYNRGFLDKRLSEELEKSRRFGCLFSIILIDIDLFKKINDTYGHLCGDYTLRRVASILQQMVRAVDIVGRYGGEEFCCVLPETPLENASILAERLRMEVAAEVFTYGNAQYSITISLGVAECDGAAKKMETLIGSADAALYRAKRGGRNKVVSSGTSADCFSNKELENFI
jgi:diguanylate cyclase (GGDEF)-like protein